MIAWGVKHGTSLIPKATGEDHIKVLLLYRQRMPSPTQKPCSRSNVLFLPPTPLVAGSAHGVAYLAWLLRLNHVWAIVG